MSEEAAQGTVPFDMDAMVNQLIGEEALRYFVYDDANGQAIRAGSHVIGNPTIGIGRNLSGNGISATEARMLCVDDIQRALTALALNVPWYVRLSPARQRVLVDLMFNMGWGTLREFHQFLGAMQMSQWQMAVDALRDSDWWNEVGQRGPMLEKMILEG